MLDLGIPVRARDAVATARTLAAVGAVLLAVACDEPWRMPPYLAYTAEGFDPSRVAEADALGRRFAADWELVPHQGIHGMRLQPDTFTMWFFHDRKALEAFEPAVWFTIQIRDDPPRVVLVFLDEGEMPSGEFDRLVSEFTNALEERFGLEFCRLNPESFLCDGEYARLEAQRVERIGS